ncbi:MAG: hypothetical protein RL607_855 [Bacteroidota bacterium]|jgi:hypothetical protein
MKKSTIPQPPNTYSLMRKEVLPHAFSTIFMDVIRPITIRIIPAFFVLFSFNLFLKIYFVFDILYSKVKNR